MILTRQRGQLDLNQHQLGSQPRTLPVKLYPQHIHFEYTIQEQTHGGYGIRTRTGVTLDCLAGSSDTITAILQMGDRGLEPLKSVKTTVLQTVAVAAVPITQRCIKDFKRKVQELNPRRCYPLLFSGQLPQPTGYLPQIAETRFERATTCSQGKHSDLTELLGSTQSDRTRTCNNLIWTQGLYQLSYRRTSQYTIPTTAHHCEINGLTGIA